MKEIPIGVSANSIFTLPKPSQTAIDYIKALLDWEKRSANNSNLIIRG